MGQTCGCSDDVEKHNELTIEQDEIQKRMNDEGSNIDQKTVQYLLANVHLIVRIQARFRGHLIRKELKAHRAKQGSLVAAPKSMMSNYASNDTNAQATAAALMGNGSLPMASGGTNNEEGELEFRAEHTFENGAVYKGQWLGEQRHGFGVQIWPDGAKYEGRWRNNKADGRGIFWHADGDVFDGEWKEDKAHGFGTYTHVNGAKYEGDWKNDLQDGQGREVWQDGSSYDGLYKEGVKHGRGKYNWSDGSSYDGEW